MYLIDSCVILEFLLGQEKAKVVEKLLLKIPTGQIFISEFTLHSIGIILLREKMAKHFMEV